MFGLAGLNTKEYIGICPRRGTLPAVLTRVSHRALPSSDGLLARCSILLAATTGKTKRNRGGQLETTIPEQIHDGDVASGPFLCCSGKSAPGKLHQHGAQHFVRNFPGMASIPTNLKGAQLNEEKHLATMSQQGKHANRSVQSAPGLIKWPS
jgi:hypothetical protein